MNFFGQSKSGKIIITPPTSRPAAAEREEEDDPNPGSSSSGCGSLRRRPRDRERERETKFAKDNYVVVPIELTGYRSYSMELFEMECKGNTTAQLEGHAQRHGEGAGAEETALTETAMELELGFGNEVGEGNIEDEMKMVADADVEVPEEQHQDDHGHEQGEEDRRPLFDDTNDEGDQSPEPGPLPAPIIAPRPLSSLIHHQKPATALREQLTITKIKTYTRNRTNIQVVQSFVGFGFYIGLIPFRFQITDRLRWKLRFYEFSPQRVFCAFVHILIVFFGANKWTDPELYTIFNAAGSVPRAEYLKFALAVSETLYVHAFILILWSKKSNFQWLAESYPVQHLIQPIHGRYHNFLTAMQNRFFVSTILIALFCSVGVDTFLAEYRDLQLEPDAGEPVALFGEDGYIVRQGKAFIFIDPDNEHTDVHPVVAYTAATLYVFSGFMYAIMFAIAHLCSCVLALIVYDIGAHFVQQLKRGGLNSAQGLELYARVKTFIRVLNDGFGILILLIVLSIVPYIGFSAPIVFMKNEPGLKRFVAILLILNYVLFLWSGVAIISKIKRLRAWLGKRETGSSGSNSVPILRIQSIYSELADNPPGLSGCGLFTVSSAFVGALVQLLAIYAFIAIGQDHPRPLSLNSLGIENGNGTSSSPGGVPGLEFVE